MWIILSLISVLIQKSERPVLWEKDSLQAGWARDGCWEAFAEGGLRLGRKPGLILALLATVPLAAPSIPAFPGRVTRAPPPTPRQRQAERKQDGGGTEGRKVLLF